MESLNELSYSKLHFVPLTDEELVEYQGGNPAILFLLGIGAGVLIGRWLK